MSTIGNVKRPIQSMLTTTRLGVLSSVRIRYGISTLRICGLPVYCIILPTTRRVETWILKALMERMERVRITGSIFIHQPILDNPSGQGRCRILRIENYLDVILTYLIIHHFYCFISDRVMTISDRPSRLPREYPLCLRNNEENIHLYYERFSGKEGNVYMHISLLG